MVFCQRNGRTVRRRILSATRLQSGVNQRGADIVAEADAGERWVVQCKRVNRFGPSDVSESIALAEEGWPHADQYVLVTTCSLSARALERLKAHPKWMFWDSARLTQETQVLDPPEMGMHLVSRYFDKAWVKRLFIWGDTPLLGWNEFFTRELSSERWYFHHQAPFVCPPGAMERLEDFARGGPGRALILSAAGGQGKSRLLLELARKLERQTKPLTVKFLNLNRGGLSEEDADRLSRLGDTLLIVDDAHRLDTVVEEVARAASRDPTLDPTLRLIVATRPHATEAIRSQLYRGGYAERLAEPLLLPSWNSERLLKLAESVLDPAHRIHAPRLVELADRCPLLVVLGGALTNTGAFPGDLTDQEDFRERVFRGFKEGFLRSCTEAKQVRLDRLIKFLSYVSPAPKTELLPDQAAASLGCTPLEVADDLEALQAAGMLIENREGIRLYPDLFADAVLLDACLDRSGAASFFHRAVLERLPTRDFPSLMRNVAQADWETRTRHAARSSLFDPIWREFSRRFQQAEWKDTIWRSTSGCSEPLPFLENLVLGDRGEASAEDREALLSQWASFAAFLPERTIELAELALGGIEALPGASKDGPQKQGAARAAASRTLPQILKPVVMWHSDHAGRALDLLWSLEAGEPREGGTDDSNAIAAIAGAGSYEIHKPITASRSVIDWLELKLQDPSALDRLRRQPCILSALLKPFFGRVVEHTWSTGRKIHFASHPVARERTRPLRQKALAIADRFLNSRDGALAHAAVPVIGVAIEPIIGRIGFNPSEKDHESWRPERLEALDVLERAAQTHQDSAVLLIRLRRILRQRCEHDPDEVVRDECQRVLSQFPDTFELRMARVLTSWPLEEIDVALGPNFKADLAAAERRWESFCERVVLDAVERFRTAEAVCQFLRSQVKELSAFSLPILAGAFLDPLAGLSPEWSATVLEEVVQSEDSLLDSYLTPVLRQAGQHAPPIYRKSLKFLLCTGRPTQLVSLVQFLGAKHLHYGGLDSFEREITLRLAERTEEGVVAALARIAGLHFDNEGNWALDLLSRLKPVGEASGKAILEALGNLAEKHGARLDATRVKHCLANLGEYCLPDLELIERPFRVLAETFPKLVYEHLRELLDATEDQDTRLSACLSVSQSIPLGPIDDPGPVAQEIEGQWSAAMAGTRNRGARLALVRSLLASDPQGKERLRTIVDGCSTGPELELATELAATPGSRFVFNAPDLVRELLTRARQMRVFEEVNRTLWCSACGGSGAFTDGELDPEYHYILEQAELLGNRYREDPVLGPFYRAVQRSQRHEIDQAREEFARFDGSE